MSTATHQRECWKCRTINDHTSDITPGVRCPQCGSQDTRRVKTPDEKAHEEKRIRSQAWEIVGKAEWTSEDWRTFHDHMTKAFIVIAARHAKQMITSRTDRR